MTKFSLVLAAVCLLHCVKGQGGAPTEKTCEPGTETKWLFDPGCKEQSCAADCADATTTNDEYPIGEPKIHSCAKCEPGKSKQSSTFDVIQAYVQGYPGYVASPSYPAKNKLVKCPTLNADEEKNEACEPCESGKVAPEAGSKLCKRCGAGEYIISVVPCNVYNYRKNIPDEQIDDSLKGAACSGIERGECTAPIEVKDEGEGEGEAKSEGEGEGESEREGEGAGSEWKRRCNCHSGYDGTDCSKDSQDQTDGGGFGTSTTKVNECHKCPKGWYKEKWDESKYALILTNIVVSSGVATVTHADTTTTRLVAGDTVTIVTSTEGHQTIVTGTPTSTTFTYTTKEADNTYGAEGSDAFGYINKLETEHYTSGCVECPSGYSQGSDGAAACSKCPLGKHSYENDPPRKECTDCVSGKYGEFTANNHDSLTSVQICQNCPKGYVSSTKGAVQCMYCFPGTFMDTDGSTAEDCKSCAIGQYAGDKKAAKCK